MSHFYAYLARMKFIPRWSLMRNTWRENLQEHSLQAAMIAHGFIPWLMKPTAINCAEPAKTNSDMSTLLSGLTPAPAASTPNAKPMGR